jgi:hypothetical protein
MTLVTPRRVLARGLAAGAIGTATMTAWQELSTKLQSSDHGGDGGQAAPSAEQQPDPWEQASAPAQVGRKILDGVIDRQVPPERIGLLTNAMHWGYGLSWGALYGLIQETASGPALRTGLLFGAGLWAMSYVVLVPMGLYQPPWKYSPREVAMDVSYHIAYGAGLGGGHALVDSRV